MQAGRNALRWRVFIVDFGGNVVVKALFDAVRDFFGHALDIAGEHHALASAITARAWLLATVNLHLAAMVAPFARHDCLPDIRDVADARDAGELLTFLVSDFASRNENCLGA